MPQFQDELFNACNVDQFHIESLRSSFKEEPDREHFGEFAVIKSPIVYQAQIKRILQINFSIEKNG